eukprot:TRINITY_DN2999_c0_g1_i1.p1 TRINITY_DN2999_c0_g1~~TRINITY_DN2999_c0_g1_i1.p1  ORF type:complete len:289 (-),score=53.73 TRINITY_DN2999_c0_g1_i1:43-909(-)
MGFSQGERFYLLGGIEQNMRNDGRGRLDYRRVTLETNVLPLTSGSARLRLGKTDVLVGLRPELTEPIPSRPNEGIIRFSVEFCSNASIDYGDREEESISLELSQAMQQMFCSPGVFDMTTLCVIPGKQCWTLFLDVMVAESDGNLLDAVSMASYAAFKVSKIPKVDVIVGDVPSDITIEISEDMSEFVSLKTDNLPISVSTTKIGKRFVVDSVRDEEYFMDGRLLVAVNPSGDVCFMQKSGNGSMEPTEIVDMIQSARRIAVQLIPQLDKAISVCVSRPPSQRSVFLS